MPAPTNPKKKSLMPSSPLRRKLRAAGHHLDPIVQVGKEGVTDAVLRQLDEALLHHELVKLKVGTESPEDRFDTAEAIASTGASIAQVLGRTILAYRRHPEKPRYEAAPAATDDLAPATGRRGADGPPKRGGKRPAPSRGRRTGAGRGSTGRSSGGRAGASRTGAGRTGARKPRGR